MFMLTTVFLSSSGCNRSCRTDPSCSLSKDCDKADYYTCVEHADIKESKAGKCSKCGMNLKLKKCERNIKKCPFSNVKESPSSDAEKKS